jgi:DNA invertase Pin-like site-specific DNA recombinase
MMQARGVKVISALEPHANVETPMGKFMQTIMLAFAELYREMCRARTKIKMREHQQNGRRMSCRPPFGWMLDPADKKAIIPSPVEQAILKKMRALREAGESSYCIARSLEAARVKHPRSGQVYWSHQLIENIFSRDDYVTSLGKPREA